MRLTPASLKYRRGDKSSVTRVTYLRPKVADRGISLTLSVSADKYRKNAPRVVDVEHRRVARHFGLGHARRTEVAFTARLSDVFIPRRNVFYAEPHHEI